MRICHTAIIRSVTRRKLQTPGTAEEHNRQETPTINPNHQPRPSIDTTHRPSTKHYRNGTPGVKTHNCNQHSSRAHLGHNNHPPWSTSPNRVITRFSRPTQVAAKRSRAEPHCTTDTGVWSFLRVTPQTPPA